MEYNYIVNKVFYISLNFLFLSNYIMHFLFISCKLISFVVFLMNESTF